MASIRAKRLSGKKCIVIGAAGYGRVGAAIALRLATAGFDVAVHGSEGAEESTARLRAEVAHLGVQSIALTCDPTSPSAVASIFAEVQGAFGGLDAMVGAASIVPAGPLLDSGVEMWRETLRVNLKAPFLASREAARLMMAQGTGGKILYVSSHASRVGIRGLGVYSSSQAGVVGLVKTMALELADFDINVNVLAVGSMRQDPELPTRSGMNDGADLLHRSSGGSDTTLGRPSGEAPASLPFDGGVSIDDVAARVADLVSSRGDYVTGQVVDLTGGQLIGR